MAAVSELIEDVADVMGEPRETVNAYARALLDAELLPKSRGRAIAQVEPVHIIRLFLVVALAPKIKDAGATVRRYSALRGGGVPKNVPYIDTLEERLVELWNVVMTDSEPDLRPFYLKAVIEFVETWPEANIALFDDTSRFLEPGAHPDLWRGYFKRSAILHARAFAMLGSKSGRDYQGMGANA